MLREFDHPRFCGPIGALEWPFWCCVNSSGWRPPDGFRRRSCVKYCKVTWRNRFCLSGWEYNGKSQLADRHFVALCLHIAYIYMYTIIHIHTHSDCIACSLSTGEDRRWLLVLGSHRLRPVKFSASCGCCATTSHTPIFLLNLLKKNEWTLFSQFLL